MNTFIVFFLLSCIVIALFYKPKKNEKNENFANKFNGSVHIRGSADLLTDSNQKIKCDKLCIRDSVTGKISCIEPEKLFYLTNNKDSRLKMICLGNTCINQNHIDILKGKNTFRIVNYKNKRCLGNYGTKTPIKSIHDDDDDCKHFNVKNTVAYTDCNDSKAIDFHIEEGAPIPNYDDSESSGISYKKVHSPPAPPVSNNPLRSVMK